MNNINFLYTMKAVIFLKEYWDYQELILNLHDRDKTVKPVGKEYFARV